MKEPIVFLPDMMCDARLFGPQIAEFSADRAVMCAPISQGERIEEMASELLSVLPAKFALAGLGMGGSVALEILRRSPERVTRIALIDTDPAPETPQAAAAREVQIIGARAGRLGDVMRETMKLNYLAPTPQRADVLSMFMEMAETMGPEVFVRQSRALQRQRDHQSTLRKCKVPALVMCGEYDALCPVKRHVFMAELIPYAELKVISNAGHLPTIENPAATTAALHDWLAQPFVLQ